MIGDKVLCLAKTGGSCCPQDLTGVAPYVLEDEPLEPSPGNALTDGPGRIADPEVIFEGRNSCEVVERGGCCAKTAQQGSDAIFLSEKDPAKFACLRRCVEGLLAHGLFRLETAKEAILVLTVDIGQGLDEAVGVEETSTCEAVEAAWKGGFFEIARAAPDKIRDSRMPKRVRFVRLEHIDRFEQDSRIHPEVLTDTMQYIWTRKALTGQIAIVLCPVDAKITA